MKSSDIRKKETLDKYLELVKEDIEKLVDKEKLILTDCPACRGDKKELAFNKMTFDYVKCLDCGTLYASPRPDFGSISDFYTNSVSSRYWVEEFFAPMQEARREKIFVPRVKRFLEHFKECEIGDWVIGEVGAGFGIFLEELKKEISSSNLYAIEPSIRMADICKEKDINVINKSLEEVDAADCVKFDLLAAFELMEHLMDPAEFIGKVHGLLKPGGYFLFTTLNGKGFDIQVLGERSKAIFPPLHINFFNPGSIKKFAEDNGFQPVSITTPGRLDWDIVENMYKNDNVDIGPFWKYMAETVDEKGKEMFQSWLRDNCLSSHMEVLLKKVS